MRATSIGALVLTVMVGAGAGTRADDLTADQMATCDHITHAMPTPARVAVAIGDPVRVLFLCPGDPSLGWLMYRMRDADELAEWQDHTHERIVIEGETDDD